MQHIICFSCILTILFMNEYVKLFANISTVSSPDLIDNLHQNTHRARTTYSRLSKIYDPLISTGDRRTPGNPDRKRKMSPNTDWTFYWGVIAKSLRFLRKSTESAGRTVGLASLCENPEEKCRNYREVSLFLSPIRINWSRSKEIYNFRMLLSRKGWNCLGFVWGKVWKWKKIVLLHYRISNTFFLLNGAFRNTSDR